MKKHLCILLIFGFSISVLSQDLSKKVSFEQLISEFQNYGSEWGFVNKDTITKSSLYKDDDFNVSVSENPIYFEIDTLVVKNPFYTENFDDWDDNYINFPISFSVIYEDNLISLFDKGKFVCHNLSNNSRNIKLEKKLNTKKFKYHWVIDGRLFARSKSILFNRFYQWDGESWEKAQIKIPINKKSILFSDERFIVYRECSGEFGGTIYFFDRESKETFFTESTCANTVFKKDGKYQILSHLGHMVGTSEIKTIENPKKLTKARRSQIKKQNNRTGNLGYEDKTNAFSKSLDFRGIQLFSTFKNNGRRVFLAHLNESTFLVEINGSEIQVVNPLFNNDKYTHDPITKTYDEYTLINMDFYGIAFDREVSVIIIKNNKITLLDWNENHN